MGPRQTLAAFPPFAKSLQPPTHTHPTAKSHARPHRYPDFSPRNGTGPSASAIIPIKPISLSAAFELLLNGSDNGLVFFDSADSYGSHPHVANS